MVAINPDYAPAKTAPRSKNRVGNFFSGTPDCVGSDRSATRNRIGEKRPCSYDTASGVTYYGFRYYDPVTGRWPSRDPLGEAFSRNAYAFVENVTIDYFDVLGLWMDAGSSGTGNQWWSHNQPTGPSQETIDTFVNTVETTTSFVVDEVASQIEGAIMSEFGINNPFAQGILGMMLNPTPMGDSTLPRTVCSLTSQDDSICPDPDDCYTGQGPDPMITCNYSCNDIRGFDVVASYTRTEYAPCGGSCPIIGSPF